MQLCGVDMECAIFDMDGTILDSMGYWHTVSNHYLAAHGKKPSETLWDDVKRLTLEETAVFIAKTFGIGDAIEDICAEFRKMIFEAYSKSLELKEGAREFLEKLKARGIPCVLATATDRTCVDACLSRLGIMNLFSRIFTCAELGTNKRVPLIFERAAQSVGADISRSVVFEDALHCIRSAKNGGFRVCAIHDDSSDEITEPPESDWARIIRLADKTILAWNELL